VAKVHAQALLLNLYFSPTLGASETLGAKPVTVCGRLSVSGNDFLLLDHNTNVYVTLKNAENWRDWNGQDIAVFGTVRWIPAVIGM